MVKKVWVQPVVAKLSVKDVTRGTGGPTSDVCGGEGIIVDCSAP